MGLGFVYPRTKCYFIKFFVCVCMYLLVYQQVCKNVYVYSHINKQVSLRTAASPSKNLNFADSLPSTKELLTM